MSENMDATSEFWLSITGQEMEEIIPQLKDWIKKKITTPLSAFHILSQCLGELFGEFTPKDKKAHWLYEGIDMHTGIISRTAREIIEKRKKRGELE